MITDAEFNEEISEQDVIAPLDFSNEPQVYRVAVGAVGGQGGGAISEIIYHAVRFERSKNIGKEISYSYEKRSMTPGLAQRSGSTLTSLAFVDPLIAEDKLPQNFILSEMPHIGSCNVVVAQEMNELMKYIHLCNPRGWILANEMRTITPPEKSPSHIPLTTLDNQIQAAKNYIEQGVYIGIDGNKIIKDNNIDPRSLNVVMLGIFSAANILPISRESYLKAINIRFKGKIFEMNKAAFELGETYFLEGKHKERDEKFNWFDLSLVEIRYRAINNAIKYRRKRAKRKLLPKLEQDMDEIIRIYPEHLAKIIMEGYGQLIDFQDRKHGKWFLNLVAQIFEIDSNEFNYRKTKEFAQNMAVRIMQWNGPFRVAEHAYHDRFEGKVDPDQLFVMEKKLQPTLEEIVGMIPVPNFIYKRTPKRMYNWYQRHLHKGKSTNIRTTSIFGFLFFWFLSKMKAIRKSTVRYRREKQFIEKIMSDILKIHNKSAMVAEELAWYIGKIRGYSYVRINHILAYNEVVNGIELLLEEGDDNVAVNFIKNCYNTISNSGEGVEIIDDLVQDHLRGQFIVPLTFSN